MEETGDEENSQGHDASLGVRSVLSPYMPNKRVCLNLGSGDVKQKWAEKHMHFIHDSEPDVQHL